MLFKGDRKGKAQEKRGAEKKSEAPTGPAREPFKVDDLLAGLRAKGVAYKTTPSEFL